MRRRFPLTPGPSPPRGRGENIATSRRSAVLCGGGDIQLGRKLGQLVPVFVVEENAVLPLGQCHSFGIAWKQNAVDTRNAGAAANVIDQLFDLGTKMVGPAEAGRIEE